MYLLVKIWGYITPLALQCAPTKQANSKLQKHYLISKSVLERKKDTLDSNSQDSETDVEM